MSQKRAALFLRTCTGSCLLTFLLLPFSGAAQTKRPPKIFDAHVHEAKDRNQQLLDLKNYHITSVAFSSSWDYQQEYRKLRSKTKFLYGIMFPCPNGIMPYSGQTCFSNGKAFPDGAWLRKQIISKRIDFIGELLNEYYGISPADSVMFPYYALAQEFNLPVGIHTGYFGPDNLSPNADTAMGHPMLLEKILNDFPRLRVWIMHAGQTHLEETLKILADYPRVYVDISVINNPNITPTEDFYKYMKAFIDRGFEDRLMFGSDNADYATVIKAVNELDFLTPAQKEKIFYKNAERFFRTSPTK